MGQSKAESGEADGLAVARQTLLVQRIAREKALHGAGA
jgi:hypothetical protein